MARCRKTFDEQICNLDDQITKVQERLNSLIAQRDELIERKKKEEFEELYLTLRENNLTIEDAIALISSKANKKTA